MSKSNTNRNLAIGVVAAVVVIGAIVGFMFMQPSEPAMAPDEMMEEKPQEVMEEKPEEVMGTLDVKLGLFRGLGFAPSFIAETQEFDTKNGVNVEHVFVGPRDVIPALLGGQVDMILTVWPTVFTLAQNEGVHLVVVGNHGFEGVVGDKVYDSARIMVPNDSPIQKVTDLKGKKIGVINPTGLNANGFRVSADDYEFERVFYGAMAQGLSSGSIDAAVVVSPFNLFILQEGLARSLVDADGKTINPHMAISQTVPVTGIYTTQEFFEANPTAVKRVAKMNADAIEWMNANPDLAIADLAREDVLGTPPNILKEAFENTHSYAAYPVVDSVKDLLARLIELGFLEEGKVDIDQILKGPGAFQPT
ncbi:MAG: ABC transporter substrate-binding protein [Nitrososphaerales archaeon]